MSCTELWQYGTSGVPKLCGGAVENLDELPVAFEDFIVGGR